MVFVSASVVDEGIAQVFDFGGGVVVFAGEQQFVCFREGLEWQNNRRCFGSGIIEQVER